MTQNAVRPIFVNLPVRDPKLSMEFFRKLGFDFNLRFTDDKAACMIVNPQASVMLLARSFFQTFTKKALCDSASATEALFALSCNSREEVDELVKTAIAQGGKAAGDPVDHGFMYYGSFYDLDDHHWEVLWMDPKAAQG